MRIMGLDVGDKTIGVAVSDELGITANPVTVIQRTASLKKDIGEVRRIAEAGGVERIVVGMPLMLDGTMGIQAEKVAGFVEALRRRVRIPVDVWDERLTTVEVERVLVEMDQSRAKRRKVIDKLAAAVILKSYLDRQSAKAGEADDAR
ncbi:MAG TPA: Holliday junction resolvase RuvX [Armatimonadota bacterium]|nr:Holliday junction resolvase RuvX [Armatimonadota bacterium]